MKKSLVLCAIILALALGLGWQGQRSIALAKSGQVKEPPSTSTAKTSADGAVSTAASRRALRERRSTREDLSQLLADTQAVLKSIAGSPGALPDADALKQLVNLDSRFAQLSPEEMDDCITRIRASAGMGKEDQKEAILRAVSGFAHFHPSEALTLLAACPELSDIQSPISQSILKDWSGHDSSAAARWAKSNLKLLNPANRLELIAGVAAHEPVLAMQLTHDLQLNDVNEGLATILANTAAETSMLAMNSPRQQLDTLPDEKSRQTAEQKIFSTLADKLTTGGYESGRQWLDSAKLNPSEMEALSTRVAESKILKDTDQWIDWMARQLPPEKSAATVQSMVRTWTGNDYQAAGKWLTATPDGPTKNAAIRAYAENVAKVDPAVAKQWALTLPPGPEREETLKSIQAK
jgi:hypothetical protein